MMYVRMLHNKVIHGSNLFLFNMTIKISLGGKWQIGEQLTDLIKIFFYD
jgi:hypothetical protein